MSDPVVTQKSPFLVEVEKDKNYFLCQCGKSGNLPFCDGTHKGSGFAPAKYHAENDKKVYFCGCKHSKNGLLCDGSHKKL